MGAEGDVKYEELVIVGAGICGLATALAFHRYNQELTLSFCLVPLILTCATLFCASLLICMVILFKIIGTSSN